MIGENSGNCGANSFADKQWGVPNNILRDAHIFLGYVLESSQDILAMLVIVLLKGHFLELTTS